MMKNPGRVRLLTTLLTGIALLIYTPALLASQWDAEYVGNETCMVCHEDVGESFLTTAHGIANRSDDDPAVRCESCHGPGSKHVDEGDGGYIVNLAEAESFVQVDACNDCHGGLNSAFGFSHMEAAGGCSDCHTVHSTNKNLLKAQGHELCLSCHTNVRGQFAMPSHHPVFENRMSCYDCHQVHGENAIAMLGSSTKEQCLSCHVDKQGPFVFEHDPVNEDCAICHSAHGSVADNLLVQAEPFVCLSCHPLHFHTSLAGFEGDFNPPQHPERSGTSTSEGFKPAMLTKCTQCHTEVHGTDLPAQSISGPDGLIR